MRHPSTAAWLRRCIDPLGPRPNQTPPFTLSPRQTRKLLFKAQAHHVLPAVLQNIPLPANDPDFDEVREEANSIQIERLALSAMLNYYAERILAEAKALPVAVVKGPVFARTIYPKATLRPFTDIDLLVAPEAIPRLDSLLCDQGFTCARDGLEPTRLETKWVHRSTGGLVEVHTDLVHMGRMREAFSLTYQDLEGEPQIPAALLAVAVTHGAMHYFAYLRHVVDLCQAARALTTPGDESRFEALTARTGTRFAAIMGLTLAHRLMDEPRCLEIAKALGPIRHEPIAKLLTRGADLTATSNSWFIYNSWRRFVFRELLRYGALS